MEEILASIRRIIEDSDGERKREPEAAAMAPAANDVSDAHAGVEAFRAAFLDEPEHDGPRRDALPSAVMEAPVSDNPQPDEEAAMSASHTGPAESASPAFLEQAPMAEPVAEAPSAQVDDIEFPADAFDTLDSAPAVEGGTPEPGPAAEPAPRPPLISEQTGRQVAAAFGELSDAFAASRRRSFDEMAQEMLRPMLQEWLDNNLPHLVERMVREEIERIARG